MYNFCIFTCKSYSAIKKTNIVIFFFFFTMGKITWTQVIFFYNKYAHITSFTSINASGLKRNPVLSSSRIKLLYIETIQEGPPSSHMCYRTMDLYNYLNSSI